MVGLKHSSHPSSGLTAALVPALLFGLTLSAGALPAFQGAGSPVPTPGPEVRGEAVALATELGLAAADAAELGPGLDLTDPRFAALLKAPNLAVLARPEAIELFELRQGVLLVGALLEHDAERLLIVRADTGGRVDLSWDALEPEAASALARRLGYGEESYEEYTLLADRIPLDDGGELIGVLDPRSFDPLRVKRATGYVLLPRLRLGGSITKVRVPARELYTRAELYELYRGVLYEQLSLAPESPQRMAAELELARFCEQIRDFANAEAAYRRVQTAIGSTPALSAELEAQGVKPGQLEILIGRNQERSAAQNQVDRLDELERQAARGNFIVAVTGLQDFPKTYPKSPLAEDAQSLLAQVLRDRDAALARRITERWYYWSSRLAREYAREDDFNKLLESLDEKYPADLLAHVTADAKELDPEIEDSAVRSLFDKRRLSVVRTASYGEGTWLLGDEAAKAGQPKSNKPEDAETERQKERDDLLKLIERYQRNQQSLSQGRNDDEGQDPAEFWKRWAAINRSQWIQAYYAEFAKVFEVRNVSLMKHIDCDGTGFITILQLGAGGSREVLLKDPACNGVGVKRRISYR